MNKKLYIPLLLILIVANLQLKAQQTITYETGAVYVGEVSDNLRQGKGKITYPKGVTESNIGDVVTKANQLSPEMEKERKKILRFMDEFYIGYEEEVESKSYNPFLNEILILNAKKAEEISAAMGQDVEGKMKPVFQNGLASIKESESLHGDQKRFYYKKLYKVYVQALLNKNPDEGYQSLRYYTGAAFHNREANMQDAMAEDIMAESNYKTAQASMEVIKMVGDYYKPVGVTLDLVAWGTGTDPVSGKQLTELERFMKAMMIMTPDVLGDAISKYPPMRTSLQSFAKKLGSYNTAQTKLIEDYIIKNIDVPEVGAVDWTVGQIIGQLESKIKGALADSATKAVDSGKK